MSGFVATRLHATAPERSRRHARPAVFVVPDLDAPRADDLGTDRRAAAAAAALDARLASARAEGFAAGEEAGRRAADAAHAAARASADCAALGVAAAALAEIAGTTETAIGRGGEALARLLLAVLDAALPAAAARLGEETALGLAAELRPVLARSAEIRLEVAAGFAPAIARRLDDPRVTVVETTDLAPGDARACWIDGAAASVLADRRAALASMLASLGLAPTPDSATVDGTADATGQPQEDGA